jgi:hypothetical protein
LECNCEDVEAVTFRDRELGKRTCKAVSIVYSCIIETAARGDTEMTYKAEALAYDLETRDWTKPVEYIARDRMEAIRWCNFNRDWMKRLRVVEVQN